MSKEAHPNQPESLTDHEQLEDQQTAEALKSTIERKAEQAETADDDKLEQIRRTIEEEARSTQELDADEPAEKVITATPLDRAGSFKQTMNDVRASLSRRESTFSQIIHQPVVEKASDAASKTVGRSSLLLGGFMATFIGSLVILINARTNGYSITNLGFIVVLFVAGSLLGLIFEFIYRVIKRFITDR